MKTGKNIKHQLMALKNKVFFTVDNIYPGAFPTRTLSPRLAKQLSDYLLVMNKLSDEIIEEYMQIWRQMYQRDIDHETARKELTSLIKVTKLLSSESSD